MANTVRTSLVMDREQYKQFKSEARQVYGVPASRFSSLLWQSYQRRGEPLELDLLSRKSKRSP